MEEYGIQRHKSSPYRPQTNGAVEAANKNLKVIISKMIKGGQDWASKLPYAYGAIALQKEYPLGPPRSLSHMEWKLYCQLS